MPETEWKTVDEGEDIEVGDRLQVDHCISAPTIPGNEILASAQTSLTNFQQQINGRLPNCLTLEVVDKEMWRPDTAVVVDGRTCQFIHRTTVEVTDIDESDASCQGLQAAAIVNGVTLAVSALLLFGVFLALREIRKLFTIGGGGGGGGGSGLNTFPLILLLGAGAFAASQVDNLTDDDED